MVFLRSEPVTYFPSNVSSIELSGRYAAVGNIACLDTVEEQQSRPRSTDDPMQSIEQCLYVGVNATNLLNVSDADRVEVISLLLAISDLNCSTYLHRVLANRSGFIASRNILSSLAQAASAGTVFNNPALSAGLVVSNLVIGGDD